MPTVQFRHPSLLVLLAVVPVAWALWRHACRRVAHALGRGDDTVEPDTADHDRASLTRGALRVGALAALLLGLAGPAIFRAGTASSVAVPVVFVLDLSASMGTTDVAPDRLTKARQAIRALCALLPEARTGLVAAAQDAVVVCPLTEDRQALMALLRRADTDWMSVGGTQLRPALERARDLVEHDGSRAGVVVVVSDGEDHGASPQAVIRKMRDRGIVTHTVTVGSAAGATLEDLPLTPPRAAPIVTRARPERMAAWAAEGGGKAWSIAPEGPALPERRKDVLPRRVALAAAAEAGLGLDVAPHLYLAAVVLLAADWLRRA